MLITTQSLWRNSRGKVATLSRQANAVAYDSGELYILTFHICYPDIYSGKKSVNIRVCLLYACISAKWIHGSFLHTQLRIDHSITSSLPSSYAFDDGIQNNGLGAIQFCCCSNRNCIIKAKRNAISKVQIINLDMLHARIYSTPPPPPPPKKKKKNNSISWNKKKIFMIWHNDIS